MNENTARDLDSVIESKASYYKLKKESLPNVFTKRARSLKPNPKGEIENTVAEKKLRL